MAASRAKKSAKASIKKEPSVKSTVTNILSEKSQQDGKSNRFKITLALVFLAILGLLYYFKGVFVAALVNGTPIPRMSVVEEAEKTQGKVVLNNLITEKLIEQEASKKKVNVSKQEIDEQIKTIENSLKSQNQTLETALVQNKMTRKDLDNRIRVQLLVDKLIGKDASVSAKEIDDYLEKNKAIIPQDQDVNTIRKQAQEQLKQEKLTKKYQEFIDSLYKNAKIQYFVNY